MIWLQPRTTDNSSTPPTASTRTLRCPGRLHAVAFAKAACAAVPIERDAESLFRLPLSSTGHPPMAAEPWQVRAPQTPARKNPAAGAVPPARQGNKRQRGAAQAGKSGSGIPRQPTNHHRQRFLQTVPAHPGWEPWLLQPRSSSGPPDHSAGLKHETGRRTAAPGRW